MKTRHKTYIKFLDELANTIDNANFNQEITILPVVFQLVKSNLLQSKLEKTDWSITKFIFNITA